MSLVLKIYDIFMLSMLDTLEYRKLTSTSNHVTSGNHSSQSNSGYQIEDGWQISSASYCEKYAGHDGSTIGKSLCGPTYTLSLSFIMYAIHSSHIHILRFNLTLDNFFIRAER